MPSKTQPDQTANMATPTTRRLLEVTGSGTTQLITRPIPSIPDDYLLVRTSHVALNPADWDSLYNNALPTHAFGHDVAGTIVGLGSNVTKQYQIGERIAGLSHGMNKWDKEQGGFADHVLVKSGVTVRIPSVKASALGMQEASTLPVAINTIGLGLYHHQQGLGLPLPSPKSQAKTDAEKEWVFVYGGSTAMGTMAIQFAKLSGYKVVTVASPSKFSLAKSFGADAILDYRDPNVGHKIRDLTNNALTYVLDTIGERGALEISFQALASYAPAGRTLKYRTLYPVDKALPRSDVEYDFVWGYTTLGERYRFGEEEKEAIPEHYEFASKFWSVAEGLLEEGKVRTHPIEVREGGLEGIMGGLEDLKELRVSGVKLVYRVEKN